jgi:hypothetical protein
MRYVLFVLLVYMVIGTLVYWRPKWWRGDFTSWQDLIAKKPQVIDSMLEAMPAQYDLTREQVLASLRVATALYWPHVMQSALRRKAHVWRRARRVARFRPNK